MIGVHLNRIEVVQHKFESKIISQRANAITRLSKLLYETSDQNDKDYVQEILNLFEKNHDILLWRPDILEMKKQTFHSVPVVPQTNKNGKITYVKSKIKDKIVFALGYNVLRSSFYPSYFQEIGIKACVYCNSQLTISAQKSKNQYSAKFDIDHYHPKDDYPFLSICLYNLYPACASCNRVKSTNQLDFILYTDDPLRCKRSEYQFTLNPNGKAQYLISKDPSELKILFKDSNWHTRIGNARKLNESFAIEGIYNTQIDIVEELIVKSQSYNAAFRKMLKNNFSKLALHPSIYERVILGNYTREDEIHKRPMSKFMMDIGRELGIIEDLKPL